MTNHPRKPTANLRAAVVRSAKLTAKTTPSKTSPNRRTIDIVSDLPALTFGQLAMLTRVGTRFSATIRRTGPGYTIEVDVGPRRWVLVSTHRKTPRVFFHLDGAARAIGSLNPLSVALELGDKLNLSSTLTSKEADHDRSEA